VSLDLQSGMTTSTPAAPLNTGYTADDTVFLGVLRYSVSSLTGYTQHKFQEIIFYPTDMTALRTRIEGDLAWYY